MAPSCPVVITVRITKEASDALDELAVKAGCSRSAAAEEVLVRGMGLADAARLKKSLQGARKEVVAIRARLLHAMRVEMKKIESEE